MAKNYGFDFSYDKEKKECVITNNREMSVYDIELLFRISALGKVCKYRKILKLKPGQTKTFKVKNSRVTNVELMKYEYEDVKSYIKKNIPMWLCILLCVCVTFFLTNVCNSVNDVISGILFISLFPFITLIMNLGARYDFREEEKSYYSSLIVKPVRMEM